MHKYFFILFILYSIAGQSQSLSNKKSRLILFSSDTVTIDSLGLIPGSVILKSKNGELIDSSLYKIDYATSKIYLPKRSALLNDTNFMSITYRTFPLNFSNSYSHKNLTNYTIERVTPKNPFSFENSNTLQGAEIFKNDGLNKNGSIARGISFGNNQDVVVNSSLNLQVSGRLTENIDIALAATDNNIPIQPDGSTQQLQDFDRVYMQLSDKKSKLIIGDFPISRPTSYFMNFNKKATGLYFTNTFSEKIKNKNISNKISACGAVSRGKFSRFRLQGQEGSQGPYRLQGAENEPFIIVLSGTENVYIDGVLLKRGQENDYIIDYNTAEITFTARNQITKDKRIVVEFQYTDKNYARSLFYIGNEFSVDKLKASIHIYSEQDSKNQPLQQQLNDNEKRLLIQIGDTLTKAITSGIDSTAFNTSEVFYEKLDSAIGTNLFKNVYAYSTNSEKAKYRLTFSFVGAGAGNYVQTTSSANGKVFKWVMPDTLTGKPTGSHEPVVLLITPKQKQLFVSGIEYKPNKNNTITVEGSASKNDLNTFSPINSSDDWGAGLKIIYKGVLNTPDSGSKKFKWLFRPIASYEYVSRYFSPIERYRPVEFERDWNRLNVASVDADQHWITAGMGVERKNAGLAYAFNSFLNGPDYNGFKHDINIHENNKFISANISANKLDVTSTTPSSFYRTIGYITGKLPFANFGVRGLYEKNERFKNASRDTLTTSSFYFYEWEPYIQSSDSAKHTYELSYKQRYDFFARNTGFIKSTFAEMFSGKFNLIKTSKQNLSGTVTLRKLEIIDSTTTSIKPDNTLTSRVEHSLRLGKGVLITNTFYEIGSGLELQKEFSFLEVAPGQGNYSWIDYNGNEIKELNEFEIAIFSDQAKYIKVFTPTNKYIRTYQQQFSQSVNLNPSAVWATKKGFRKFISLFSNQAVYRIDKKTTATDLAIAYNPFVDPTKDSALLTVNSLLRNTLFFNQTNTVWGIDLTYQNARNQALLTNGTEWRSNTQTETKIRWNFSKKFTLILQTKNAEKSSLSQYFSNRNYVIKTLETTPNISFQPNTKFRLTASYKYSDKKNNVELAKERAFLQDLGLDMRYNILSKASLNAKVNYILINYKEPENTAIAFEMLEGLRAGKNATWQIGYQQNVSSNVQVNVQYNGRKTQTNKPVHVANVQVRAFF